MATPDISYLTQIMDTLVTYGPWAVSVFLGLYVLKRERATKKERDKMIKKHEDYHTEVVSLVRDATRSKASIAGRMITQTYEIQTLRKALEQFCSLITEGVVNIVPINPEEDVEDILKELIDTDSTNIRFKKLNLDDRENDT